MDRFLWLKSVIFNPIKPICDDINHKAHKGHKARTEGFFGLSGTALTFARPLWSLCSLWLKSVIFNPIKPIYDEYKPQSSQRAQSPHERFFGLSGTVLTFARPLWSLCSLWLKSVICNPIEPIYDEYKPQSSQRTQSPHEGFFGLSRTRLTFARPLWSLCSLWLNSVYRSPINPKIQRLRSTMTIAIILGTRPEIIKMAPVIRECQCRGLDRCGIRSSEVRLL